MKKGNQYIFIMVVLLVLAVFGGWFLMEGLLSAKEKQILGRKGQVVVSSVVGNDKNESYDRTGLDEQTEFAEKILSEEEIAAILSVWEQGGREIPHEPLEGQMSMEQAIGKGKWWISNMMGAGMLPNNLFSGGFDSTTARLYIPENESDIEPEKLGMWEIIYKKDDAAIDLKIHAWSGVIWMADVAMDRGFASDEDYMKSNLIAAAFPFFSWLDGGLSVSLENGIYYEKGKNGKVYIMLQNYDEIEGYRHSGFFLRLSTKADVGDDYEIN